MRLNKIKPSASKQSGALLIESMVAIAVFSIALLSLSGLQISSSKNSLSAAMRTESAIAISTIVDRMRSNIGGVRAGNYNVAYGATPTGTNQAVTDIDNWLTSLQSSSFRNLNTQGQITCVQPNALNEARDCEVRIRWNDTQAEGQYDDLGIDGNQPVDLFELTMNINL